MNEIDWKNTPAAIWRHYQERLKPIGKLPADRLDDLLGIEKQKTELVRNTERFLSGLPSNNVLMWGSRGTGKSTLLRALLNTYYERGLRMIEIDKDDLTRLPELVDTLRELSQRFVIFSDDLSFEIGEKSYKVLKTVLEGSLEPPADNVRVYATSNRRHLMPEPQSENESSRVSGTEIHHGEAIEEKIALSDRFGLWLSFYPIDQQTYLSIVDHYFRDWSGDRETLHIEANRFAIQRGGRSGRAAWQFFRHRSPG